MTEKEMLDRTKAFALRILKLVAALPNTIAGRAIGGQLVRSEPQSPQTTELLVEDAQRLNLLPN